MYMIRISTFTPALACLLLSSALTSPEVDAPLPGQAGDSMEVGHEFDAVENFRMDVDGMRETVQSLKACREVCLQHGSCRSFSWSEKGTAEDPGRTCIWTAKYIGFDPRWEFHTRTYAMDWTGKMSLIGAFHKFPGMRFVENRFHDEIRHVTVAECESRCEADHNCKAFSFNSDHQRCLLSDSGLRYAPGFTYYERNRVVPGSHNKAFEHFPMQETEEEKAKRSRHESAEAQLAQADRRERDKKNMMKEEQEAAAKRTKQEFEHLQREASKKKDAHDELRKKQISRREDVRSASQAALQRGEYAEMMHKASTKVELTTHRIAKERKAKLEIATHRSNFLAHEVAMRNQADDKQHYLLKKLSKLNADLLSTEEEHTKLENMQAVRLLQTEAYKLGQKERQFKGGQMDRFLFQETLLRQEYKAQHKNLEKLKASIEQVANKHDTAIAQHEDAMRSLTEAHAEELKLARDKSASKIWETQSAVAANAPKVRLQKLKVIEAKEIQERNAKSLKKGTER